MTRSDTLRAIAAKCRGSHAASLLAVGWLLSGETTDTLEKLAEALEDQDDTRELLDHLARLEGLMVERWATKSRLD